ncbi:hypothetical protein [Eubacterium callanderi]|uniref:hypothetical protein n=1 Tax=Eubacterium callanderi TaxID=53442 RepID=UPI0022E4E782|nr:hypothetical protein [Eubacterium callanderi]
MATNTKDKNLIDTPTLKIEKNVVRYIDAFIEISNISQVTVAPVPKDTFPVWSIILIVIGIIVGSMGFGSMVAFLFIGIGAAVIIYWYIKNNDTGNRLNIFTNAGTVVSFYGKDKKFLTEVMEVLIYCANNSFGKQIIINMKDGQITNSPIILGDHNTVK